MRANATTTLLGRSALLVPYSAGHVEAYHSWMEDEGLREATASERLTLEEEREMQRSWAEDDAKLTFIVCDATAPGRPPVGDVNLFFSERSPPPAPPERGAGEEGGAAAASTPPPSSSSSSSLHETAEVEVMIAVASSRGKGLAREAVLLCLWWASGAGAPAAAAAAEKRARGAPPFSCSDPPAAAPIPRLRVARAKIGRRNAASLALFGSSLGFSRTGGSDFFEEDHFELELFENRASSSPTLCPLLARVGEYVVVGEVERGEDAASWVLEGERREAGRG